MYVDDPVVTALGAPADIDRAFDVIILWWLVLGVPLSLGKGVREAAVHKWIGALFSVRAGPSGPESVIQVPEEFAEQLFQQLQPFAAGVGHVSVTDTERMLGRAGRLAYIVPTARPYITALWGAWAGSKEAAAQGRREAPPNRVPARRFQQAAMWVSTLLKPPKGFEGIPLEQVVCLTLPAIDPDAASIQFDASPWGAGAVLLKRGAPQEFFELAWTDSAASSIGAVVGQPASQTLFEYLALYLLLRIWAPSFTHVGVAVLGDNLASLTLALNFKGKAGLAKISRELSWRKVRGAWRYAVAHLPSEHNSIADALSRTAATNSTEKQAFPVAALSGALRRNAPDEASWWCATA